MDNYIKARLERAERYLNDALAYSKGEKKVSKFINHGNEDMVRVNLGASFDQFKKIEKYIHQCGTQAKEDAEYVNVIK